MLSATDRYDGETHNVKQYVKKFDAGVAIGTGYAFDKKLSANIRSNAGLVKWYEDERNASSRSVLAIFLESKQLTFFE